MLKVDSPLFLQNMNMIARQLFLLFKRHKILYAYRSTKPLEVAGIFKAFVAVADKLVDEQKFVVISRVMIAAK